MDEKELLKRLQQAFKEEASERLLSMDSQLSVLELNHSPQEFQEALETIFRDAHSLKGAARSVGLSNVEPFFQAAEDVFGGLKKKKVHFSPEIVHLLQHSIEVIEQYISAPDNVQLASQLNNYARKIKIYFSENQNAPAPEPAVDNQANKLENAPAEANTAAAENAITPPVNLDESEDLTNSKIVELSKHAAGFMRINKDKLDTLLQQSDELIVLKQLFPDRLEKIRELQHDLQKAAQLYETVKTSLHFLRRQMESNSIETPVFHNLLNLCRRIENTAENIGGRIDHLGNQVGIMSNHFADDVRNSVKMVDGFRDKLKMIAMMPFASLTGSFPRMMRELAAEIGREFEFVMSNVDIEIDRRVLDELRDPLIHLLRNAADHGIEPREKRIAAGKKPTGKIELNIGIAADKKIEISVKDDGGGINAAIIRRKLIEEMQMPESIVAEMTEEKVVNHIFNSGFSTSRIITSVSGRGLGMAIVREKVEALGGSIRIENSPGQGSCFILSLPAALSSQRGILFMAGGQIFAIPANGIESLVRIKRTDLQTIKGTPSINLHGEILPVFDLAAILGLSNTLLPDAKLTVIILSLSGVKAGFIVENVLREREMLVKPLGSLMPGVHNVNGITVTSSGQIVPVLNSREIIHNAMSGSGTLTLHHASDEAAKPIIMIAEDSITSRTLLTNILASAGYQVETAVDGESAWEQLQKNKVDLLVSDIEMPRMDGFALTEKVRNHQLLATLPVVLVTSLSKPEDRERGINLGANAYITKGDFSQTHLLDTIERLL